jgi:hypothetical protein
MFPKLFGGLSGEAGKFMAKRKKLMVHEIESVAAKFWRDLAVLSARVEPRDRRGVWELGIAALITSPAKELMFAVADPFRILHWLFTSSAA